MSEKLSNMLDSTIAKIREMVNANTVMGDPIVTPDGTTVVPVSKISIGLGGGGSDFVTKNANNGENPFGGGVGAGVKVTPVAFLVMKEGNVRVIPMAVPASTTADRLVEMVPDTLDKIVSFIDSKTAKKSE
ncbi:MAG: GerW family sporulation protein [Oscillospiraceae bacterium]|nr:GerW family sporulation protein [Oscillospiraceae bacterium]